jgi:predicted S18 family serine protease
MTIEYMKKLLIALLLIAAVAGIAYYVIVNKPHKDVNDEKAVAIAAPQLFAEFVANEAEANKKYLNKAILVTGAVSSVEENQDKQKYVILQTDDALNGIMCTMRSNDFTAKAGDNVSVKGFCSGFVGDVKLTDCVLSSQ